MIHPDDLIGALGVSLFDAPISADQYDGLSALIDLWNSTSLTDPRWLAYILATVHHETGKRFMPVRETFAPDDATARRCVATMDYGHEENGHVYYGRGFVQITWLDNYKRIGTRLGIDLAGNPDLALDLDFSARIAVIGMIEGLFTGAKLSRYFNATVDDPIGARHIINGQDRAEPIAGYHASYLTAIIGVSNGLAGAGV
jgi:predicted chitinase